MSERSAQRAEEFLKISHQFQLGVLTTEASHPVTANLSETARGDIVAALGLLFDVDGDVVRKYQEFAQSDRPRQIQQELLRVLRAGGKIFFTGCGSTGRLSIQLVSIWRDFWQRQRARGLKCSPSTEEFENRAFSVMAGGDFALIKAVEGFEDFTAFGKKQLGDLGVAAGDVVFAITEGGETSFVIGTAWKGLEAGAKVYFVYNNPDEVLCQHVGRSREVIQEPRIEKINLTTGPMAITGSTRMQATTIQLCVLLTVLEMALRELMAELEPASSPASSSRQRAAGVEAGAPRGTRPPATVPEDFLSALTQMHTTLKSRPVLEKLAKLVSLEESVYRSGHKNNYFAGRFGIDVLTDTTERSPTYCTPPFRKFDDTAATESWAFLFVPADETSRAWEQIIKRRPRCVEWSMAEVLELVGEERAASVSETVRKISYAELMRFKVGLDGLPCRPLRAGDCAVGIVSGTELDSLRSPTGFHRRQLEEARRAGAAVGLIAAGNEESLLQVNRLLANLGAPASPAAASERAQLAGEDAGAPRIEAVLFPAPKTDLLLDGVTRVGLKMLLNALSTCTMVRLGRVMGNYMIWVVPSNLKLIDRSTRYIQRLTGMDYRGANHLLFEVIEYVEPRMKSDRAYPPVVGVSVMRQRFGLDNAQAEQRLMADSQ